MKMLEDFKIKHLGAFVANEVGKSVYIVSITIDPDIYIDDNENDFQQCTIEYGVCGQGENETADFIWYCEDEELLKV